jgi:serine/threonine protein phosphatase 1
LNDMSTNRRGLLPATAKGDAIYAIGDIHGRYDLWKIMVETIERHAAVYRPDGDYHIIVLDRPRP